MALIKSQLVLVDGMTAPLEKHSPSNEPGAKQLRVHADRFWARSRYPLLPDGA